jgi:capsular exopolysaccharide synthesis family protein
MAGIDHNPWEKNSQVAQSQTIFASETLKKNVLDIQPARILAVWPFIVLGGLLAFFISWTYLRYSVNIYQVTTSVVLENNKEMGALEAIYSTKDPLNDQIALLKSPTVARRVVDTLFLQYHTLVKGQFKDRELFSHIRWSVVSPPEERKGPLNFELQPTANGFNWKQDKASGSGNWGNPCNIGGSVVLIEKIGKVDQDDLIYFYENDAQSEAEQLSNKLFVSSGKESNVVSIGLQDAVPARAVAILKALIPAYSHEARISKSLSLQQSLKFIEERLIPVTAELDSIESSITQFKVDMGLTGDLNRSANAESQIEKYEEQLDNMQYQRTKLADAEKYLINLRAKEGLSVSSIGEPGLQSKIDQYNKFQLEKKRLSLVLTDKNPKLWQADALLDEAKEAVETEFSAYKNNVQKLESSIRGKLAKVRGSIIQFPDLEKRMEKEKRMQGIKQGLYNMLLETREEVSIKLAGVSVQTSVLSAPKIPSKPISPKRDEIMISATLAGLLLPLLIVLMREFLNNKIISKKQLQQITNTPVLSEIDLAKNMEEVIVVKDKDRSIIGEQFRSLRTNLGFYKKIDKTFYAVVTSSMSGEGKSFISANLAASFALLGKKVALLEFDLRKPKLRERFGLPSGKGIVNVLLGELEPASIVQPVMEGYHLDLMISGPIPPNPSELIAMPRMENLKQFLDDNYDVVIIDTPPFGLVTDAQLLDSWADISLVVVRFMNTFRDQVAEIEEARQNKAFGNMAVIFNGIKTVGYYGYRYGYYGQKRKYGYGYYAKNG